MAYIGTGKLLYGRDILYPRQSLSDNAKITRGSPLFYHCNINLAIDKALRRASADCGIAAIHIEMEAYEGIYLNLSKEKGKCKMNQSGLGWKPSGGGDTFTLGGDEITGVHWSRAAKGYEVKIFTRTSGVVQLDGFDQEVSRISS